MTERDAQLRGSCLCGGVQYSVDGPAQRLNYCHCRMCQKAHGTAFAPYVRVAKTAFTFTAGAELVASFQSSADITRTFCSRCGSTLQWIRGESTGLGIAAGTFDTDPGVGAGVQIWVESRADWHALDPAIPAFETEPG